MRKMSDLALIILVNPSMAGVLSLVRDALLLSSWLMTDPVTLIRSLVEASIRLQVRFSAPILFFKSPQICLCSLCTFLLLLFHSISVLVVHRAQILSFNTARLYPPEVSRVPIPDPTIFPPTSEIPSRKQKAKALHLLAHFHRPRNLSVGRGQCQVSPCEVLGNCLIRRNNLLVSRHLSL
jgi:hypothetical protein